MIALAMFGAQLGPATVSVTPGSEPELSRAFQQIAALTDAGKFDAARAALRLLPLGTIHVDWDDSAVPSASRFDFARQRDIAIAEWEHVTPLVDIAVAKKDATVRVAFSPGTGMKQTWSTDPEQPRLTVEIGLKQGSGPVDPATVHNDFSFALGSFFGIAKLPMPGFLMEGVDSATQALRPNLIEGAIANADLNACKAVQDAIGRSQAIKFEIPTMSESATSFDLGQVVQGTQVPIKFPVSNTGKGPLSFRVLSDCGCIASPTLRSPAVVEPGKSRDAIAQLNTTDYNGIVQGGVLKHTLWLLSNDPAQPTATIPLGIKVIPRYRMLPSRQVVIADKNGDVDYQAFLFFPTGKPMEVTGAETNGWPGQSEVKFTAWKGALADPELNEGPLPRSGYEFTLHLKGCPDGQQFGTNVMVSTDDPQFPMISYILFVQKGIIAQPPGLFLGEIGAAPRKMSFLVTRRGEDFKIMGVKSDSPHLTVSSETTGIPGEYRVTVAYDGKDVPGDFHATVMVMTDDPSQPELDVAVTGTIRDPKAGGTVLSAKG
ncbi:MAG TPA: DUF1573 domain-containing protein [Fimbriimonadaceae bacterium]|nr:DUF1573 domain-containing protein [Fimbriimonadaceae bacterium]